MSVLDAITIDLEPSATYGRREASWVPLGPGEGYLTIRLWRGKRAGSKMESDVYSVMEEAEAPGVPGRSFLLLNTTDGDQPDVYRCRTGPYAACTCKAGLCGFKCKHCDSLTALISEEVL